jgi:hypothetical protein
MNNEDRCPSYYQNLNPQMQRLGDPVRCRLTRGHLDMHQGAAPGRQGTVRWPDVVQMVHPWQITGGVRSIHDDTPHEHTLTEYDSVGHFWYCVSCGEQVAQADPTVVEFADALAPATPLSDVEIAAARLAQAARAEAEGEPVPRRRRIHEHENWQVREAPDGSWYCAACGETVTR